MLIDKLGGSLPSPEKLSATMSTGFFFFGPRNQWRGFRTSDSAPRSEAVGTPQAAGVM